MGLRVRRCLPVLLALALLLATAGRARAQWIYEITVDTSGLPPLTAAYFDLQLNPADPTSPALTATIASFSAGAGGVSGVPQVLGDVVGTLPGSLTLTNSTSFNDYYQGFNTGNTLSFLLTLNGPALSQVSTNGTSFLLALYQSDGMTPLGGGADPTVAQIDLLPDGIHPGVTPVITVGPGYPGGPAATVASIPESSTLLLGAAATATGLLARWIRPRGRGRPGCLDPGDASTRSAATPCGPIRLS